MESPLLEESLDAGPQKGFFELNLASDESVIDYDEKGKGTEISSNGIQITVL